MDKRTYDLIVGVIFLVVAISFFVMPGFLNLDPFIPVMLEFISFIIAVVFFFSGYSEK